MNAVGAEHFLQVHALMKRVLTMHSRFYKHHTAPIACLAWGDPHVLAFGSARELLLRGSCWHTLTTDIGCPGYGDNRFAVLGKFKLKKSTIDRSFIEKLRVKFHLEDGSYVLFDLDQGPTVFYTDNAGNREEITTYPSSRHGISVDLSTQPHQNFGGDWVHAYEVITLRFPPDDMMIRWDGMKKMKITLPPAMHGHVCGMCGPIEDYTGDMLIGPHDITQQAEPHCPTKAAGLLRHSITRDPQEFADSWYSKQGDEDDSCLAECNPVA